MGKKGSSAPPPDPRLVEAQIKSMGIQDEMIQRIMANSDAMLPLQQAQMQFGLDSAKTAYYQSQQDRDWMLERRGKLSGLQDQLILDAKSYNEGDKADQLADKATADVRQAFGQQRDINQRNLTRMGINPNDGKFAAMHNQTAIAEALGQAFSGTQARTQAKQESLALTDRATNALAGYPAMGMQATGQGAGFGLAGLDAANKGLAGMNSGFGAAGGMAGQMGQNATNMFGQQASYQANMQQQGDSLGGILGGLGGLATGAAQLWAASDRRLKENIRPVGKDQRTGLTLYEFSYLGDDSGQRYVGVMADEVQTVMPQAVSQDEHGYQMVNYAMLGIAFKRKD